MVTVIIERDFLDNTVKAHCPLTHNYGMGIDETVARENLRRNIKLSEEERLRDLKVIA